MKKELKNYDTIVRIMLLLLIIVTVCFIIRGGRKLVSSVSSGEVETSKEKFCVVIDAGHGGSKLR